MYREFEQQINKIEEEISTLSSIENMTSVQQLMLSQLKSSRLELIEKSNNSLTPEDRVYIARHAQRPNINDYINALFTDFFPLCGDRNFADDHSIVGGIAYYKGIPVTIVGHKKGRTLQENIDCNFGMPNPEGYRKALRLMQQAEKFSRPIITFIDTPGAYPGIEAEARGQGEAIAKCLFEMSGLRVPVISVVIGEGGSGGALALSVADRILMLENAVFSILSPEGFATILWKDSKRSGEACELMKLTAQDLYDCNIADRVIKEPIGGAHKNPSAMYDALDKELNDTFQSLLKIGVDPLVSKRYKKLRSIGSTIERK